MIAYFRIFIEELTYSYKRNKKLMNTKDIFVNFQEKYFSVTLHRISYFNPIQNLISYLTKKRQKGME